MRGLLMPGVSDSNPSVVGIGKSPVGSSLNLANFRKVFMSQDASE